MFVNADDGALQRYQFALCTADFLLCRRCGVYLGAVLSDGTEAFVTLNTRAMTSLRGQFPATQPVDYAGEAADERRVRRRARWTPVAASV